MSVEWIKITSIVLTCEDGDLKNKLDNWIYLRSEFFD